MTDSKLIKKCVKTFFADDCCFFFFAEFFFFFAELTMSAAKE